MAASISLVVAKGEAVTFTGTHQTSATDVTPVDITGWTIAVTVKSRVDGSVLVTKGATVANGPLGKYTWSVTATDTGAAAGVYDIDIWRTDAGAQREMAIGKFAITGDVLNGA